MHDVRERGHRPAAPRADTFAPNFDLLLVVEGWKTLVAVERLFVFFGDLPDHHGNGAVLVFLDGEVGPCLASFEKQLPAIETGCAEDRGARAAHPHLRNVEVAAVGDVVSSFHSLYHPFRREYPSTALRPPERSKARASGLRPSSGGSSVAEGRVAGKVAGQEVSGRCELLADEAQAEEPGSHRVLGVLVLLGLGACRPHVLRHLAEREAKLNVALELPGMDAAPAVDGRLIELEEPELDGALGEGGVVVEHMVAAVVVVLGSAVVRALARVPDVCEGGHRGGLLRIDLPQEVGVDRPAVAAHAVGVELEGFGDQAFVACHDVRQVAERLRCVAVRTDVDVDSAAPAGVALRAVVAKLAAKFLKGLDVAVVQDRGDQFAFLVVRTADGNVLLEFPLTPFCVPCAPGAVAVAARGVLVPAGAEVLGGDLGRPAAGDAVHLDLDPDGLVFHLADLSFGPCVHGVCLLENPLFSVFFSLRYCIYHSKAHK